MCCSSLASAVNVSAIIATIRHLFGLGLGFFVCKSIHSTDRTELEKGIYSRLQTISSSKDPLNGDVAKIEEVIFPWAVTLTTMAGIMILASFAMMYSNLRDGTQCLAIWLFLTIIDTVISPTTIGIYTFKFIENKVLRTDGSEQKSQIQEISIFAGAMITYYLIDLALIGITWKRYVQIKQDNEQKFEEPYTIPMNDYGENNGVAPRGSNFNVNEYEDTSVPNRAHMPPESVTSEYYLEDSKGGRSTKRDERWHSRFDERLSPEYYNNSRRASDNVSAISDYDDCGRRNSYFDNMAMEPDQGWENYGRSGCYPSSEISFGRRLSLYPPGADVLSERRFSMYQGAESNNDRYSNKYLREPRKLSSYVENDIGKNKKQPYYHGNDVQSERRMSQYPSNVDCSRRQSAYFGDRNIRY